MKLYEYVCSRCDSKVYVTWKAERDSQRPLCPDSEDCGTGWIRLTGRTIEGEVVQNDHS